MILFVMLLRERKVDYACYVNIILHSDILATCAPQGGDWFICALERIMMAEMLAPMLTRLIIYA